MKALMLLKEKPTVDFYIKFIMKSKTYTQSCFITFFGGFNIYYTRGPCSYQVIKCQLQRPYQVAYDLHCKT